MADSVDFKRQQIDLRKIVGVPEGNKGKLGTALPRSQWGGTRAIGFMNADQLTSGTATGTSGSSTLNTLKGTTLPGNVTNGTTNKPADETGGNEVDPKDPSKSIHGGGGGGQGEQDAEKVIDNATTMKQVDQYESGIGQITSSADGGGTLNALTGIYDCDNPGIEIEIRTDGMFKPPEGWDNPDVPPDFPFYQQQLTGKQWRKRMDGSPSVGVGTCIQSAGTFFATLQQALDAFIATLGSCYETTDSIVQLDENICGTGGNFIGSALATLTTRTGACNPGDPTTTTEVYFEQFSCTPNGGTCPSADVINDPNEKWPADGKLQLSLNNGVLAPSDREALEDRVEKFFNGQPRSQIDFCFGDGRHGTLMPTSNMGYMIYETSGGIPTGIIKIFGSNNRVIGYTDVAGMNSFLPE